MQATRKEGGETDIEPSPSKRNSENESSYFQDHNISIIEGEFPSHATLHSAAIQKSLM